MPCLHDLRTTDSSIHDLKYAIDFKIICDGVPLPNTDIRESVKD